MAWLLLSALQGVDNVYTQHQPLLSETLRLLAANDLNAAAYPYMAGSQVRLIFLYHRCLQLS
jgi:vacuolar protein sorting-associated protein 45